MNSVLSLLPHDMTVLNRVGVFCTLENSVEFQKWLSAGGYKASLFAFEGRQRWFSVMLMGTSWLSYLHCDTINKVLVTKEAKITIRKNTATFHYCALSGNVAAFVPTTAVELHLPKTLQDTNCWASENQVGYFLEVGFLLMSLQILSQISVN